ncbi:MAG: tRNA glutamyl-Q(34) synthetase GluQRS, partial [Thiobacillus sp.]|nr:tRNA glutamyl-Q(34) synthetase GluQRS [Thiobacillus sp.]
MAPPAYRGRFAPTPSGPLHFGSLVAALGSCLEARSRDGAWLLRIEDVDPPRVVAGSADAILRTLDTFGFEWDGPVVYQSRRTEAYRAALADLRRLDLVYACSCSRKQLAETARRGIDGTVYPGTCRARHEHDARLAQRFRVPNVRITFTDGLLGRVACDVAPECGDFVLRRADGVYTYQLAVVVDDAEQGISHIVRGADLLTSTPRQIVLQQALGLPTPSYLHL